MFSGGGMEGTPVLLSGDICGGEGLVSMGF